jgi:hypothetical protein
MVGICSTRPRRGACIAMSTIKPGSRIKKRHASLFSIPTQGYVAAARSVGRMGQVGACLSVYLVYSVILKCEVIRPSCSSSALPLYRPFRDLTPPVPDGAMDDDSDDETPNAMTPVTAAQAVAQPLPQVDGAVEGGGTTAGSAGGDGHQEEKAAADGDAAAQGAAASPNKEVEVEVDTSSDSESEASEGPAEDILFCQFEKVRSDIRRRPTCRCPFRMAEP